MSAVQDRFVEVDRRNHVSLASIPAEARRSQYLMSTDEDGVITLRPAVVLTEFELAYRDSEARKMVEESRAYTGERATWRPGPPAGL